MPWWRNNQLIKNQQALTLLTPNILFKGIIMANKAYKSEAMDFIKTLLEKPGNHEQQMKLRSTWWDKGFINQDEQEVNRESSIKSQAYVYFSYPTNK